jgi:hypothetical protein
MNYEFLQMWLINCMIVRLMQKREIIQSIQQLIFMIF